MKSGGKYGVYQPQTTMIKVMGEWESLPTVSLELCEYNRDQKRLSLPSEYFGMPLRFRVVSHKTGKSVTFAPVTENDPLFDQDQWDGVQQIYRPVDKLPNVEYLVIYDLC